MVTGSKENVFLSSYTLLSCRVVFFGLYRSHPTSTTFLSAQFKLGATDVSETTNVSVFRQATTEIKRVSATFSVPAATPLAVYGLNLTLEQDGEEVIMKTMVITPTNGPPPPPPGPDVVSQLFDTN